LSYTDEALVSSDFTKDPHSAIVDGPFTKTLGDDMVKVLAWYDNEWGYSSRLVELAHFIGERLTADNGQRTTDIKRQLKDGAEPKRGKPDRAE